MIAAPDHPARHDQRREVDVPDALGRMRPNRITRTGVVGAPFSIA